MPASAAALRRGRRSTATSGWSPASRPAGKVSYSSTQPLGGSSSPDPLPEPAEPSDRVPLPSIARQPICSSPRGSQPPSTASSTDPPGDRLDKDIYDLQPEEAGPTSPPPPLARTLARSLASDPRVPPPRRRLHPRRDRHLDLVQGGPCEIEAAPASAPTPTSSCSITTSEAAARSPGPARPGGWKKVTGPLGRCPTPQLHDLNHRWWTKHCLPSASANGPTRPGGCASASRGEKPGRRATSIGKEAPGDEHVVGEVEDQQSKPIRSMQRWTKSRTWPRIRRS